MNDRSKTTEEILLNYFWNELPEDIRNDVKGWLISDVHSGEKEEALEKIWNSYDVAPTTQTYAALDKITKKLGFPEQAAAPKRRLGGPRRKWFATAAVLVPLVVMAGVALWLRSAVDTDPVAVVPQDSTVYAKNMNKPQLATVIVMKEEVAGGERRRLTLPDSSAVWVNSGSSIAYGTRGEERVVQLEGEAYFDVTSNPEKPFVVAVGDISIRVLGTRFNVKGYGRDEQTVITLDEGSIEVLTRNGVVVMRPGESVSYNRAEAEVQMSAAEPDEDWRTEMLSFEYAPLSEIFATLERFYDVTFTVSRPIDDSELYTVSFTGKETIEQVLQVMSYMAGGFRYDIPHTNSITIY